MRLICPNCGAQYDVDAGMIPEAGRDVQCSNCGHGWFQHPEEPLIDEDTELDALEAETEQEDAPEPEPEAPPRRASKLDPTVTDVLRAEAEREAKQRRAEVASAEVVESQPELGLDTAEDTAPEQSSAARARMARLRGLEETTSEDDSASRKELLPDVEEINSTLRTATPPPSPGPMPEIGPPPKAKGGFRFGFFAVLVLVAAALLVYAFTNQIIAAVPASEPYLVPYAEAVNTGREALKGYIDLGIEKIQGLASSIGN